MKKKIVLFVIFLISVLHFWQLDRLPVSLTPDELEVVLSGYTYAHYGVDLAGYGLPMSLWATQTHGVISPLPPLVYAALWSVMEPNVWVARLVPTLLMLGTAFFLYRLAVLLFAKRAVGALVAMYFLVTPWQWHYAHYAADTPFALFFFVSGIYFLLREKQKYWWIGLSLLVGGFFSYHGAKLLFLPILFLCSLYQIARFAQKSKNYLGSKMLRAITKNIFPVLSVGMIFFGGYLAVLFSMKDSIVAQRGTQLFFLNDEKMSEEVNYLRQRILPSPLASIMVNKVTVAMSILVSNYLTSFSPDVLFAAGDTSTVNRWYVHGLLYRWDAVLLLVGLLFLWQRYRKQFYIIVGLIVLAPLPSAVSNFSASVIHRSFLLAALLPMLSAIGIYGVWEWMVTWRQSRYWKWLGYGVLSGLLLVQVGYYFFSYYYRLPLINPDGQYWGDRVLAAYMDHRTNDTYVATGEPRAEALAYLMYTDSQTRAEYLRPGQFADLQDSFVLDKVTISAKCPAKEKPNDVTYVIARDLQHCYDRDHFSAILSPKDGGVYFRIYGDTLCNNLRLQGYTYPYTHTDFSYYPDDAKRYCERWISDPVQL